VHWPTKTHNDKTSVALCFHFNGHFPGEPGLAGFIGARYMEVVVTTGTVRHAKLQSNHHHQQTNIQLSTDLMPFLSPNKQRQSTEGKR